MTLTIIGIFAIYMINRKQKFSVVRTAIWTLSVYTLFSNPAMFQNALFFVSNSKLLTVAYSSFVFFVAFKATESKKTESPNPYNI